MTRTKIASVGKSTKSIRTVIPLWIAELMELKKGDEINWNVVWDSKNKIHNIEIRRVENE